MTATPGIDEATGLIAEGLIDLTGVVPVLRQRVRDAAVDTELAHLRAPRSDRWMRRYRNLTFTLDAVALLIPACGILITQAHSFTANAAAPSIAVAWLVLLLLGGAYEQRFLGSSEEMRRVLDASIRLAALVGCLSWLGRPPVSRTYVLSVVLLGTCCLFVGRLAARFVLHRLRSAGRCRNRVLAVGSSDDIAHLVGQAGRAASQGFEIVAACVPGGRRGVAGLGCPVPVVGKPEAAVVLAQAVGADTIAVTNDEVLGREALRRLAWRLQESDLRLLLAPALTDVAGPRVSVRPLAGLPLLHVAAPSFTGPRRIVKGAFDRFLAAVALAVLSPALLVIAISIKLDSKGPVLYRQERVGLRGSPFPCYKFRSMVRDAESRLADLKSADEGNGILFKLRNDPRVTGVGRILRRYSLDELPQLLNVLGGSMSLVGPRPPLQSEVDRYESDVRRRLLVKPGITGLWQVSGRSDLPWEESVRLDLYYVENWSPFLDVTILARTTVAVLKGSGAY